MSVEGCDAPRPFMCILPAEPSAPEVPGEERAAVTVRLTRAAPGEWGSDPSLLCDVLIEAMDSIVTDTLYLLPSSGVSYTACEPDWNAALTGVADATWTAEFDDQVSG